MDLVAFLLLLLLIVHIQFIKCEGETIEGIPNQKTKSQLFELNKQRLRELWHTASLNGLIKAHAKSMLPHVPRIEQLVYRQCEKSAKNTVSLARCAVVVYDARDYSRDIAERQRQKSERQHPRITIIRKPDFYSTGAQQTINRQNNNNNTYNTIYSTNEEVYIKSEDSYYYSPLRGRVRNPIRAQRRKKVPEKTTVYRSRPTRMKREDPIMTAWDLYLKEEREKKKKKDVEERELRLESIASLEAPEVKMGNLRVKNAKSRNIWGLPRHLESLHKRSKRRIEQAYAPESEYSKMALNFFQKIFQGTNLTSSSDHLGNLQKLRAHFARADKVKAYYKLMNDENKKLFDEASLPFESREPADNTSSAADAMEQVMEIINQFMATQFSGNGRLSIMSPRLFSIVPEKHERRGVLSPTLLSFQEDGFFSLPDIFTILTSNQLYQRMMLEMIMEVSGAGKALDKVMVTMKKEMEDVAEVQYPLVLEMSRHDLNWLRAQKTFTAEQKEEYDKHGFAFLEKNQMELMYNDDKFISTTPGSMNISRLSAMNREEKEKRLETHIRNLAAMGRPQWPMPMRAKRQAHDGEPVHPSPDNPHPEGDDLHRPGVVEINGVEFVTLLPLAFSNLVGHGVSMEVVTLSPIAFISEIMLPEALGAQILSPRAFLATILSPSALIARILSPTFFHAEVLSPRALQAWVLSPEIMLAEVLNPRFLEPRVLSPEAFIIEVLSPGFLSPMIMSSEGIGVIILSPNILSPRIASEEKMLVEVLSPHILGGPHSEEEKSHEIVEVLGNEGRHEHGAQEEGRGVDTAHGNTASTGDHHSSQFFQNFALRL